MAKLLLGEDMSGDKWWLPLPCVPSDGFSEQSKKQLDCTYDFTNQILKACKSVNNIALAEMEVPKAYIEARPKVTCLDSVDLSSEHVVVEMENRVEASTYIWRRRAHSRHLISLYRSTGARPSWGDSEKDDESSGNTFDWSEKGSGSQLKRAQEREREHNP
ncbi:hypothetical protein Bca52824_072795 [Brassica carinata]|uniref:PRONE domain-containing protein n=1 Tax=Brassica carinata TaxID=52824 RepID=A0A8X7U796_BRACI|nr:hypothetical protein Bca52824_072795 [Brassica carinata]